MLSYLPPACFATLSDGREKRISGFEAPIFPKKASLLFWGRKINGKVPVPKWARKWTARLFLYNLIAGVKLWLWMEHLCL